MASIYSYQLILINTDKLNSNAVTWNKMLKLTIQNVYTLNDDSILRNGKIELRLYKLDLAEDRAPIHVLIKNSKD